LVRRKGGMMMVMLRSVIAIWLLAPMLLSGCATMDKNQCVNADWHAVGVEDGARGRPLARLGDHRRACAKYGVAPESERYLAGRNEGLKAFCTYERGYAMGHAGQGYADVCPEPLAASYRAGYRDQRGFGPGRCPDMPRHLIAVHFGHSNIRDDKIEVPVPMKDFNSLLAILRGLHAVPHLS